MMGGGRGAEGKVDKATTRGLKPRRVQNSFTDGAPPLLESSTSDGKREGLGGEEIRNLKGIRRRSLEDKGMGHDKREARQLVGWVTRGMRA